MCINTYVYICDICILGVCIMKVHICMYIIYTLHINHMTTCSYHVTNAFYSELTLDSCLNVKELLAQHRCDI